jgi:hypothetical protein
VANRVRGRRKAAAARKGHRNTTHRKSAAGSRKAAWARWGKRKKRK